VSFTMSEKKNEVVMLEQQITRESILKPVPIVGKVDYSGAYEVFPPFFIVGIFLTPCRKPIHGRSHS
jgi:hypothetical protein